MTQHQISQGYHPSLGSMFHRPSHTSQPALLFQKPESAPHPHHQIYQQHPNTSQAHAPYTAAPARPPLPPKEMIAPPPGGPDPVARELKPVSFPRDCLNRFTSIASINTTRNRETCGLLLGKDKGGRFVVTTLLIPKQHSTSDTCTMDEEELVMQFTEERSLITLGWVRRYLYWLIWVRSHQVVFVRSTHIRRSPVSCFTRMVGCIDLTRMVWDTGFMSSVDLHTHSGFQRMLPESFAVVCAPHSTPKYVI